LREASVENWPWIFAAFAASAARVDADGLAGDSLSGAGNGESEGMSTEGVTERVGLAGVRDEVFTASFGLGVPAATVLMTGAGAAEAGAVRAGGVASLGGCSA
jgi:hypothetical protein